MNRSPHNCYVSTAYSRIRLYDTRKNCKPSLDFEFSEKSPINNIVMTHNDKGLLISNYNGGVFLLDNNNKFKIVKKFGEARGSVTDITLHY